MIGDNCSSRCETRDHATFGECMKAKGTIFGNVNATATKNWDKELDMYASARKQGIQPDGTTKKAVQKALDFSDRAGAGYGVDFAQAPPMGD
jgi:hypothetical protein